jgi:hypothetical protein
MPVVSLPSSVVQISDDKNCCKVSATVQRSNRRIQRPGTPQAGCLLQVLESWTVSSTLISEYEIPLNS